MPKINVRGGPSHIAAGVPRAVSRPIATAPTVDAPAESVADRPAASASKAEWVAYAETLGVDTDGLTKAEIVEAVG